jgi:Family of unknown function (DUF6535)
VILVQLKKGRCNDCALIQAGLFAAFLSAFLIETLGRLEEDSTATLLDVMIYQTQMMRNDTLPPYHHEPFTPSPRIIVVNTLFFASLTLILVVAFISMLVKGWTREFDRGLAAVITARRRALVREYRYLGLEGWKFLEIVHFLPVLIYLSLLLFFCGLSLFLLDIETACGFVIAAIFALGVLFYMITTAIATIDDSAPFRSPLSRALGHQFQRLHSVLLKDTRLWQPCLLITCNTNYPRYIRGLFDYFARMAQWKPFSEADFHDEGDVPVLDEQDINTSSAIINKLHMNSHGKSVSRELFQSLVLAGDPAHIRDSEHPHAMLGGWAPRLDEMTPEAVRAIGVLICCAKSLPFPLFDGQFLPVLMGSSEPWDRLLACLVQSRLYWYSDGLLPLESTHVDALTAINESLVTQRRVLLVARFLGSQVLPDAESETKAAAVRILSALLSQLRPARSSSASDQLVHTILHTFSVINDVPLPEDYHGFPLSEFPSLPYLAYNPHILSRVITPTRWCSEAKFLLPACEEFARALIEWLWRRSAYTEVDSQILRGVPLSQVEEYALNLPSDSSNNLIWASLLLETLISESGRPRSDFPALNEEFELEEILIIYDSYLIQCSAMPSLPMQSLLRLRNTGIWMPKLTVEIQYPWLALHTYTLMRKGVPRKLIPTLKWSDTPALNMIACNRLKYYDSYDSFLFLEPPLLSVLQCSSTYEAILGAFKWHIILIPHSLYMRQIWYQQSPQNLDLKKIIEALFGPNLNKQQMISSWLLVLDVIIPSWSQLPNELKLEFVGEFFKPQVNGQRSAIDQNICLGIAWVEHLWSTVLASLGSMVYIEEKMDFRKWLWFRDNTFCSGPMEMESKASALERETLPSYNKRKLERAQHDRLVLSVNEVLSTLTTLLKTAHEANILPIEAVAYIQTSPVVTLPQLHQDTVSVQCIEMIINNYHPHLCPLPEFTPQEAALLAGVHLVDPATDEHS